MESRKDARTEESAIHILSRHYSKHDKFESGFRISFWSTSQCGPTSACFVALAVVEVLGAFMVRRGGGGFEWWCKRCCHYSAYMLIWDINVGNRLSYLVLVSDCYNSLSLAMLPTYLAKTPTSCWWVVHLNTRDRESARPRIHFTVSQHLSLNSCSLIFNHLERRTLWRLSRLIVLLRLNCNSNYITGHILQCLHWNCQS
jgi:hypothetical protein